MTKSVRTLVDFPIERYCKWCGEAFSRMNDDRLTLYCSENCKVEAEKNWGIGEPLFCIYCGRAHRPDKLAQRYCCASCQEKAESLLDDSRHAGSGGILAPKAKRHCHDCGRPTNDFRCDKCREKFLRKYKEEVL